MYILLKTNIYHIFFILFYCVRALMLCFFFLLLQNIWSNSLVILSLFFWNDSLLWEFSFGRKNGAKKKNKKIK